MTTNTIINLLHIQMLKHFNGQLPDFNGCRNYLESHVPIAIWGIVYDNEQNHVGEIHEAPEIEMV